MLFRLFPQPLYRQDSHSKTSLVPRQPTPFFSILPSKVAYTVSSFFILHCWVPVLEEGFSIQLLWWQAGSLDFAGGQAVVPF